MAIATQTASSQPQTKQTQDVDFYFDVSCPWTAYGAVDPEVAVRPIQVTWKFLSLAKINEAADYSATPTLPVMQLFRCWPGRGPRGEMQAVERLYVALGQARHERKESLADAAVIDRALTEAGLDPA